MAKLCTKCGETKADSEFYIRRTQALHSWCIACMKELRIKRNPVIAEYQRRRRKGRSGVERDLEKDYQLQYNFGITLDEYNTKLENQNYCCAICGKESGTDLHSGARTKQLSVDHDHRTGLVRGLLCNDCNRAIGQMKDDVKLLRKAAEYLETWENVDKERSSIAERLLEDLMKLE